MSCTNVVHGIVLLKERCRAGTQSHRRHLETFRNGASDRSGFVGSSQGGEATEYTHNRMCARYVCSPLDFCWLCFVLRMNGHLQCFVPFFIRLTYSRRSVLDFQKVICRRADGSTRKVTIVGSVESDQGLFLCEVWNCLLVRVLFWDSWFLGFGVHKSARLRFVHRFEAQWQSWVVFMRRISSAVLYSAEPDCVRSLLIKSLESNTGFMSPFRSASRSLLRFIRSWLHVMGIWRVLMSDTATRYSHDRSLQNVV